MTNTERFSRLPDGSPYQSRYCGISKSIAIATLLMTACAVTAQEPVKTTTSETVAPEGYTLHQTADLGGHMAGISGSGAMYDTLVNIHPGPRVLGQTFTLHALPGSKHGIFDSLTASSNGFGGDPINVAKLDVSKGKLYEFNAMFRRDRQYFDYDLLGNPSVPAQSIPYGMAGGVATSASLARNSIQVSPVMFNTVRRMTDTHLTITPLASVVYRFGYSQNIFQGPSTTPNRSIGKNDALLQEYQRNSNDDFNASLEWKPGEQTRLTFEEQVDHYKGDSYFTIAPSQFNAQLPDGTPVALGNWDATASPYTISMCNTASMGTGYTSATTYTIFTAPTNGSTLPVVNPGCAVTTKFLRTQPTRALIPTEMVRFQSSSIKNIELTGDARYTIANSTMNYNETWAGLDGIIRGYTQLENSSVQRRVVSFDFGIVWNATKTLTLSDQVDFSNIHQPGSVNGTPGVTLNTPALTTGNANLNYNGPLVSGTAFSVTGNASGTALYGYFGQRIMNNNATASWDPSSRASMSLTYRYRTRMILQGAGSGSAATLVGIDSNTGIFNLNLRPVKNWTVNGSVEIGYDNNALVPVSPRQLKHYRVHTLYHIKPWATLSAAYNDIERHNNTNNVGPSADGPIQHVDYNRNVSMGLNMAPNEHYAFDINYSYNDNYYSTNACYSSGATATLLGTASYNAAGGPNICPSSASIWGPVKDFMSAPSQYGSAGVVLTPNKKVRAGMGYRISKVDGNQFFADAQQVNGSLSSKYQTPYVNIALSLRPQWIWKAEYNYYGYGEGGPSGPQYCSTSTSATATVIPCASSTLPSGLTEPTSGLSASREFHANIVTLSMHYEF